MAKRQTRIPEVLYSEDYKLLILTEQPSLSSNVKDGIIARPANRFDPDQLEILMKVAQPVTSDSQIFIFFDQDVLRIKDHLRNTEAIPVPIQSLDQDVQEKLKERDLWTLHIAGIQRKADLKGPPLNINPAPPNL
jgi:hypothetical protein